MAVRGRLFDGLPNGALQRNVRFTPKSRHQLRAVGCPLSAKSGLMRRSNLSLFDHLVGNREHLCWYCKMQRSGGLSVDD